MAHRKSEPETETDTQIRLAISALMDLKKISGPAMARHLEMSPSAFYDRLNGRTRFSVTEIHKIAEQLEVAVTELIELGRQLPPDLVSASSRCTAALLATLRAA